MHIRVQPHKSINGALLMNKIKLIDGTLDTISESSVTLHVQMEDIEKLLNKDLLEKEFEIAFQVPTEKGFLTMISAKATIFTLINETIILSIQPNAFMKSKLRQYVALRQSMLMVDLKQQLKHLV